MPEPNLDELNVATRKRILPGLVDSFFKNGPVMRFVKEKRLKIFPGGTHIQSNFLYKPMKGAAYKKGGQFDITKRQTKAGLKFDIKKYYVNITEFLEDIEIELRTPEAAFSTVQTDLANAALTLSAILEIAIWQHGQDKGGDNDRSAELNGFEEALNDGTNNSWNAQTFSAYGEQTRADVVDALLPPTGLIAASVNGQINNRVLEHSYQSCVIGEEHPKLGVTSTRCMGFINENYLPLQRLQDTLEPTIGWPGVKFKQATIVESNYIPGADGKDDPDLGNYRTPEKTIAGKANQRGEIFAWLNPGGEDDDAYFQLQVPASPKFQFGFTGFKGARDDNMVAGQILYGGNFIVRATRLMRILHDIIG